MPKTLLLGVWCLETLAGTCLAVFFLGTPSPITLAISPAHGYDPLIVTLEMRVALPLHDKAICAVLLGEQRDQLSCQPLTPGVAHYTSRFVLHAGDYDISAFLDPSLQRAPARPVHVIANVADPR